jgi:hypothetical protein
VATLRKLFDEARGRVPRSFAIPVRGDGGRESCIIAADATRLSVLSTLLVVILWFGSTGHCRWFCACRRRRPLIGIAAVNFWFGSVHAITLGFGVTLLGEAVDYPSYLLTQVERDERPAATLKRFCRRCDWRYYHGLRSPPC